MSRFRWVALLSGMALISGCGLIGGPKTVPADVPNRITVTSPGVTPQGVMGSAYTCRPANVKDESIKHILIYNADYEWMGNRIRAFRHTYGGAEVNLNFYTAWSGRLRWSRLHDGPAGSGRPGTGIGPAARMSGSTEPGWPNDPG